ncbi:hypothetical protein NEHOM01_0809 [Nematocida homosporus]|uniref:uncharacterized protein n=1 Tax=Nematocida homosporus TaxID=1912981 RepID=UPI00221EF958|nr:uncharacterized protein NEHOM01_0809 [Nematocida homosporus]KAI5185394.1 hypothetical protein NEHOM01_0809 [Nematocida homosporus]
MDFFWLLQNPDQLLQSSKTKNSHAPSVNLHSYSSGISPNSCKSHIYTRLSALDPSRVILCAYLGFFALSSATILSLIYLTNAYNILCIHTGRHIIFSIYLVTLFSTAGVVGVVVFTKFWMIVKQNLVINRWLTWDLLLFHIFPSLVLACLMCLGIMSFWPETSAFILLCLSIFLSFVYLIICLTIFTNHRRSTTKRSSSTQTSTKQSIRDLAILLSCQAILLIIICLSLWLIRSGGILSDHTLCSEVS